MKELLPGLPPYEGGCVSPEIYNAGQGLHARPNDERPIRRETKRSKAEFLYELELITRFGVKVDRLTEDGENLRLEISNGEDRYRVERTADELFVETLTHRPMDRPTLARLVTDTTREAFFAYLDRLKALGYESVWQNRIDQNECCQLAGGGRLLYACFNGATGQARFIDDPVSERVDTFGSPAPEHPVKTQICQLSLYYDYNMHKRGLGIDCGMLYIVRLPDRSLFLVDGGEMEQATEAAMPELLRVMREMAEQLSLDLVEKGLTTNQVVITVGYDMENLADPKIAAGYDGEVTTDHYGRKVPKHAHGTACLPHRTSSTRLIVDTALALFDDIVDRRLLSRRLNITACDITSASESATQTACQAGQLDLLVDYEALEREARAKDHDLEEERRRQQAILAARKRFGKNAVLKGTNLQDGATQTQRNRQIGGHQA